ncbi:MAG: zeta toxin family protein, partial [Xanthomonadaceae bacterium]|nr:zeta toxin family protein [Xanthomonadaceae bacterium]
MDNRLKYKLSDIQSAYIFEHDILPQVLRKAGPLEPSSKPAMMIVGGQPGAGKSQSIEAITEEFAQHGGVIQANVDDLREFHPQYHALTQANDRTASNYTHADAKQWAQRIEDYARTNRYNVLVESLMTSPDGVGPWLEDYRRAGYATEVRIVAVNERASLQGIVGRYEAQKARSGEANVGRTVPREVHDMAYSRVLDTVEKIETKKLADRVVVHVRDGRIIYENALQPDGQWQHPPAARQAIIAERGRSLMPAEWNEHIKRFDDISANQHRPGRHASVDEIDEVRQLRRSAVREGGLTAQVGMHP